MRRALRIILPIAVSLPPLGSALIVLSSPPLSGLLPVSFRAAIWPLARQVFLLMGHLAPDSLPGRLFYGSYDLLVPIFGRAALAVHAILLGLPWIALALVILFGWRRKPKARVTLGASV